MSAKMKARRRHDRRKRILTQRRENGLFFAHGIFPSTTTAFATCSCGARAFTRNANDAASFLADFDDSHAYCETEY